MTKFKDLEIGDRFRMEGWEAGVVEEKIEPCRSKNGVWCRHREVGTDIRGGWIQDDDEVILVEGGA